MLIVVTLAAPDPGQTGSMPEGDTIHRSATRLAAALAGRAVVAVELSRSAAPPPPPGTVVERVEARGKYLLVGFDDGTVLETHLKMTGSWHLYRRGERWRRARGRARAVVTTEEWEAVCFDAPHVRLLRGREAPATTHLGPDLTGPDPDRGEVLRRLARAEHANRPLIDVVLDQRLFCGVGNVYANEVLWACGRHPEAPLRSIDDTGRRDLVATAHRLLRVNLGRADRRTVAEGLAVYGRRGRPCRRCGAAIRRADLGRHRRATFWCPRCQPAPPRSDPGSEIGH